MLAQLNQTASSLYNSLSPAMQPSFFQLVLHPVQATATLATMWISAGMNNMRASQARLSTNDLADQVETLFDQDYDLEEEYHTILGGTQFSPFINLMISILMAVDFREMGSVSNEIFDLTYIKPHQYDGPNTCDGL